MSGWNYEGLVLEMGFRFLFGGDGVYFCRGQGVKNTRPSAKVMEASGPLKGAPGWFRPGQVQESLGSRIRLSLPWLFS